MHWSRRNFCLALGAGTLGGLAGIHSHALAAPQSLVPVSRTSRALGSDVSISVYHESKAGGEAALDQAFRALDEVEEAMSLYRPSSEISRLNRDGILRQPHRFWGEVLDLAERLARDSDGKFDITVQPLWLLHSRSHKEERVPRADELSAACRLIDWTGLQRNDHEIRLARPGMAITLNGIAQGFAADRCLEALRAAGVYHAMVNTGEIGSLGSKPGARPWRAGIQHPREEDAYIALADLDGRCLATSGDYATTFGGGRGDHHLFDPKTGRSAREFSSVSIVAPSGLLADGLSTAVFVLGPERGLDLVRATAKCDALCVLTNGRVLRTAGFPLVREEEAGQ